MQCQHLFCQLVNYLCFDIHCWKWSVVTESRNLKRKTYEQHLFLQKTQFNSNISKKKSIGKLRYQYFIFYLFKGVF